MRHFLNFTPSQVEQIQETQGKTVTDEASKFGMTKEQHLGFEAAA